VAASDSAAAMIAAEDRLSLKLHDVWRQRSDRYSAWATMKQRRSLPSKEAEVRVRRLSRMDAWAIGVPLMRNAFKPDGGALADLDVEAGERVATMELFGALSACSRTRSATGRSTIPIRQRKRMSRLLLKSLRVVVPVVMQR
jgi:hypothetical protein